MKTNTILKAGLSATAILALTVSGAYAMGNGQGQGKGMGQGGGQGLGRMATTEERAKLQSMSQTERQAYMNELRAKYNVSGKGQGRGQGQGQGRGQGQGQGQGQARQSGHDMDPSSLIANIAKQDVSETEKELLINQYGEERMARDLYAYAATKYPNVNTFGNITKSEQKHMDTLKVLLDRYDIEAPSDYAKDNDLYVTLKNKIDISEKDAIEVGITVEMVDIDNIYADIKDTDNDDFRVIFANIGGASYNHLRGFVQALQNNNYTTTLEWTKYISQDEVNTRGGGLKVKLAEKLEAEGISLPNQASSNYIKQNCNYQMNSNSGQARINGNINKNINNYQNRYSRLDSTKLNSYKNLIKNKYSAKIDTLSDDKLEAIVTKIDPLIEKIKTSTKYSQVTKEKYAYVLIALKEVIEEKLADSELDIDNLLK